MFISLPSTSTPPWYPSQTILADWGFNPVIVMLWVVLSLASSQNRPQDKQVHFASFTSSTAMWLAKASSGLPDLYCKGKLRCFSAICTRAMDPAGEPTCPVKKCIHRLTLAQDPRIHWSRQQNISREFNFIQGRLSSMDPASVGPERVNKHYKTVVVASRASMDHERANKALYVYANLRFLMGVDDSSDKMMELLNLVSEDCDVATAMAMESAKAKQLALPLQLVQPKHFASAISEITGVKRARSSAQVQLWKPCEPLVLRS